MPVKPRRKYPLCEKMRILTQFDSKTGTHAALATHLGIPLSTLNSIVKNREKVELQFAEQQQQQHVILDKLQTHLSAGQLEAAHTEGVSGVKHITVKVEPAFEDPGSQSDAATLREIHDKRIEDLNFDFKTLKMEPTVKTEQATDTEDVGNVEELRVKSEPDTMMDAVIQREVSNIERGDGYGQTLKRDNARAGVGGGQPGCKPCSGGDMSHTQYRLLKWPVESAAAQMRDRNTSGLKIQFMEPMLINAHVATRLRVSNVDHKVDEEKLKEVFSLAGTVVSVQLSQDKKYRSPGVGVVQFANPLEAIQAISMLHNQILYDCKLAVCIDEGEGSVAGPPKRLPEGLGGLGSDLGMRSAPLSDVTNSIGYRLVNPGFMSRPPQMTATQGPNLTGERNSTVSPSNAVNASAPQGRHLSLNGGIDGRGPVKALGDVGSGHRQRMALRFGNGTEGLLDGSSSGVVSENSSHIRRSRNRRRVRNRRASRYRNGNQGHVGRNSSKEVSQDRSYFTHSRDSSLAGGRTTLIFTNSSNCQVGRNSYSRHSKDDRHVRERTTSSYENSDKSHVGGNSSTAASEDSSYIRHSRDDGRVDDKTASRFGDSSKSQIDRNTSTAVSEHSSHSKHSRDNSRVDNRTTLAFRTSSNGQVGRNSSRAFLQDSSHIRHSRDSSRVDDRTSLAFRTSSNGHVGRNSSRAVSQDSSHIRHSRDSSRVDDRTSLAFRTSSNGQVGRNSSRAVSQDSSHIRHSRDSSRVDDRTSLAFRTSSNGQVGRNSSRAVSQDSSHIRHSRDSSRVDDRTSLTFKNSSNGQVGRNSSRAVSQDSSHIRHSRDSSRVDDRTSLAFRSSSKGEASGNSSRAVSEHSNCTRHPRDHSRVRDRRASRHEKSRKGQVGGNSKGAVLEHNSYIRHSRNSNCV